MSVKTIALWIGGLVILAGLWWLATLEPGIGGLSENLSDEVMQPVGTAGADKTYTEENDLYSINITYPTHSNPSIQTAIDALVAEEVERFKQESVSLIDDVEAQRIREHKRPYELVVAYKPYTYKTFTSYEFDIYLDTGGAHPNAFFRTTTFNAQGDELALDELFIAGAAYLPRLSSEAQTLVLAELGRRAGGEVTPEMADTVRMGTAPSPEAIQFFYLKSDGLHLLFPPYQVAAYAAGSFDVAIPFDNLQDILKPEIH